MRATQNILADSSKHLLQKTITAKETYKRTTQNNNTQEHPLQKAERQYQRTTRSITQQQAYIHKQKETYTTIKDVQNTTEAHINNTHNKKQQTNTTHTTTNQQQKNMIKNDQTITPDTKRQTHKTKNKQ